MELDGTHLWREQLKEEQTLPPNGTWKKGHGAIVERLWVKLIQPFKDFSEVRHRYCH